MPWKAYTFREMPRAETIKEAGSRGCQRDEHKHFRGLDMGSQIVAGAANSVINATKSGRKQEYPKDKGDHQDELPDTAEGCEK